MTPENQKKYDAKLKRITEALELKEPDMIPITLSAELFPVFNAGYTVAEVVYDATMEKMKNDIIKAISKYVNIDPEEVMISFNHEGREQRLMADIPIKRGARKK